MKVKRYSRQLYYSLLPIVTQLRGIVDERKPSKDRIEKLRAIKEEIMIIARWAEIEWKEIEKE